jgi:hypothetical protein
VPEDEIEERCSALRKKLLDAMSSGGRGNNNSNRNRRPFKDGQTHEMADAKIKESERLRRALKISQDYEEGSHWKRQDEERTRREGADKDDEERK